VTLGPSDLIVLDTSVVIHLARDNSTGREIERQFHLSERAERPLISSVVRGEAGGLGRYWSWGSSRLARLEALLDEFVTVDAGEPLVVAEYAELHARSRREGHPIGDNDLWIAATALAVRAQLITNDTDFDWLHPSPLMRHYVAPVR